jgi:hypothetical protein
VLKYAVDDSRREERVDSSIERALELLTILPDARSNSTFLLELLRSPDPRVRSKATLLMARSNRMPRWAEVRLADLEAAFRDRIGLLGQRVLVDAGDVHEGELTAIDFQRLVLDGRRAVPLAVVRGLRSG